MTQPQSPFPNDTTIPLPPLSPPPESHPQRFNNSPTPVVYSLKLSDEVVKTLLSASSTPSVCFKNSESGEFRIPNAQSIPFSVHPIADSHTSTARAVCYTRRRNSLRTVGPIKADLDIQRTLSSSVAATTKKRTLDARNAGKARDLKLVDDIPATQPTKKARRKPVEKRPRAARRTITSVPLSKPTPPNTDANRRPRARLTPPANTSPSFLSPVVSPGHSNGRATGSSRSTPTRTTFSALPSRKVSPSSLASNLPKPVSHRAPTTQNRFSPVGSRGPSPSVNSPGSPRVASIRAPRVGDHLELRRQLVHFLAMGECDLGAIRERLEARRLEFANKEISAVVSDVASVNQGKYRLKDECWAEVTEKFEYTDAELAKMRSHMVDATSSTSDKKLDAAVEKFRREFKDKEEQVTNEKEEAELRKTFNGLFPLYTDVITRMEELRGTFMNLETRFRSAKSKADKDGIARKIMSNHGKFKARHEKFERALPLMHKKMKRIRAALESYTNFDEDN